MKLAVLSDIHGNYAALEAVTADIERWQPDQIIVNGDIVNRGPRNLDCLRFVKQKEQKAGWILLRGNHEDYILSAADPAQPQSGPQAQLRQFTDWSFRQLREDIADVASLADRYGWRAPDGSTLLIMHGTMQGNRVGVYPDTTADELRSRITPLPTLFITAHTHRVVTHQVDGCQIVNIGSAGLPFDDNPLVSYGRFTWTAAQGWQSTVQRLPYDRLQTEHDMVTTGFLDEAGPLAQLILVEVRLARGLIHRWAHKYQDAVLREQIILEDAVAAFLDCPDYRDYVWRPR